MTTPAERFAQARERARRQQRESRSELTRFRQDYPFGLDDFQVRACEALEGGHGVLVAAPTGSGKTVVGEFAVHLALAAGQKCFYTTPIKALSNQKYADLVRRYGSDRVGLLTGDNTINGEAPVVVMTTEVLRNMLYAGSHTLSGLGFVVMDEVHYLADRFRGGVWEEVIIHLPDGVRLVSLSATVSNAEEFGDWLQTVRGDTTVVLEEHRPVPLWQHVLVGQRLYDLFVTEDQEAPPDGDGPRTKLHVNPELVRLARDEDRFGGRDSRRRHGGRRPATYQRPSRVDVVNRLDAEGLLPAITFIFSRAGCQDAVRQCLAAGLRLTTQAERLEIRSIVEQRTADIPDQDLAVLGYHDWLDGLERGIAAHHAGLLPTFKEVVEHLFARGLVRAVFATETLALGINMPARSVVLERLVKWNGEAHVDVTPGEYTQLTGRAGRRGIDVEGHAVVLWQQGMDPRAVAGLASTRTYPLRSSFRPSYNMAVNLVGSVGQATARELLEASFAQFQADRAVVGLARQVRRNEEALEGYREAMTCHLGDFEEYAGLRRAIKEREAGLSRENAADRRAQAAASVEALRPGDVIRVPTGRRAGLAVVLETTTGGLDGPRPTVLTADRQVKTLSMVDFPSPVMALDRVRVPKAFNARNPQHRRDLASTMRATGLDHDETRPRKQRSAAADDPELARLRRLLRQHPCHGCDEREDHARWAERHAKLLRDTEGLRRRVAGRTGTIARTFDRVCALLAELGYLAPEGDALVVTDEGRRLGRLYSELDLLTAECLRTGVWEDLDPAELASCVATLVYESRSSEDGTVARVPRGRVEQALTRMRDLWFALEARERAHRLDFLREPDLGFSWAAWRWASGHRLEEVLSDADLQAGDFVRWCKQLIDLLGQVATAAPEGSRVRRTAQEAVDAVRRGVVAYSSVS
ncbi:DEAD/DEAH box helicase [Vallicoccus soli]|uniref:Probable helicase HelY n=1 Tax=Vallicoccus soli TaxID=2339232 RepID=A0A3A3YPM0_9ACTN|nr:DEAD/DEAH box helicase [Vallicoccus soli]RJK93170.1 DEAD/DEAH box helicase [Vallicoccus soli]